MASPVIKCVGEAVCPALFSHLPSTQPVGAAGRMETSWFGPAAHSLEEEWYLSHEPTALSCFGSPWSGGARDYPSPQLRRSLRSNCSSSLTRLPRQKQKRGGRGIQVSPGSPSSIFSLPSAAPRLPSALGYGKPCWSCRILFKDTLLLTLPCLILFPES